MGRQCLTNQQFKDRANKIHNNKYDYSKVDYTGAINKIIINCSNHGDFNQLPSLHLQGQGCPKCNIPSRPKSTTKDFINKAKKIHKNKYKYDKVEYMHSRKNVTIICPKHGDFLQTPNSHLSGSICPLCWKEKKKSNTEEFIEKALKKHGNKFTYEKTQYKKSNEKVIITCLKHGDFHQKPNDHLNGAGCPSCRESKGERRIADILDKYGIEYKREFKLPMQNERFEYDFYLPVHNVLIEFHGQQHYNVIDYFGGQARLEYTQACDEKKRQIAKHFRIPLLEISYELLKLSEEDFENMIFYNIKKLMEVCFDQ